MSGIVSLRRQRGLITTGENSRNARIRQLKADERKLTIVIRQIHILQDQIHGLKVRIKVARRDGNHCFRYTLRMRIGVTEGVCNMLYEYARELGESIASTRRLMFNQHVQFFDDADDSDPADDSELVDHELSEEDD